MDKVKIGFPIEYECDGIIYDGLFLREPEIEELEKRLKEINKITELEQQCKKQKEVISRAEKILNECKLLMPHEFDLEEQVDNALDILNEVSE